MRRTFRGVFASSTRHLPEPLVRSDSLVTSDQRRRRGRDEEMNNSLRAFLPSGDRDASALGEIRPRRLSRSPLALSPCLPPGSVSAVENTAPPLGLPRAASLAPPTRVDTGFSPFPSAYCDPIPECEPALSVRRFPHFPSGSHVLRPFFVAFLRPRHRRGNATSENIARGEKKKVGRNRRHRKTAHKEFFCQTEDSASGRARKRLFGPSGEAPHVGETGETRAGEGHSIQINSFKTAPPSRPFPASPSPPFPRQPPSSAGEKGANCASRFRRGKSGRRDARNSLRIALGDDESAGGL